MIGNAVGASANAVGSSRASTPAAVTGSQGAPAEDSRMTTASQGSRTNASAGNAAADAPAKSAKAGGATADAPVNAAASRDAAQHAKASGGDPTPVASDFATLLEASTLATAGATAASASAATVSTETVAAATADPIAQAGLPDQLLALLNGSWAVPPAATAATTAAGTGAPLPPGAATSVLPMLANAHPAHAAATAAAAAPTASAATPATPLATAVATAATPASASGGAFAALSELAAASATPPSDALVRDAGTDSSAAPDPIALTAAAPTLAPSRASAPAPTAAVVLPADPDAGFDDAFGSRIAWMAEQRIGHAEIRISPEHLGPIDVRVQLDGNRVSAEFHSPHAEVRQALEGSLTRLRDMLGQHGMQLGQADVGQRQSPQGQAGRRDGDGSGFGAPSDDARQPSNAAPRLRSRGLLDEYA